MNMESVYNKVRGKINELTKGNSEWLRLLAFTGVATAGAIGLAYSTPAIAHRVPKSLKSGAALAIIDLVWENIGYYTKAWQSHNSVLMLGHAPIEVVSMSGLAGATLSLMLPEEKDRALQILYPLITAFTGASLEWWLRQKGYMTYHPKYKWIHAFITYFLVFFGLHELHYKWDDIENAFKKKLSSL